MDIVLQVVASRCPGFSWSKRVETLKAEGKRANYILTVLREDEGLDGGYCMEFWRDDEFQNLARTEYSDDRGKLMEEMEFGIGQGIYKWARLSTFDYDAKEWDDGKWWPTDEV